MRFIKELKAKNIAARTSREMLVALEVPMALDAAGIILRAAMERTESRGAHFRTDFPGVHPGGSPISSLLAVKIAYRAYSLEENECRLFSDT